MESGSAGVPRCLAAKAVASRPWSVSKVGASGARELTSSLSSAICDTTTEGLAPYLGLPTRRKTPAQPMRLQGEW